MKKSAVSPPWREKVKEVERYENAKLRATNEPGQKPTMYVPRKAPSRLQRLEPKDDLFEIDPELRYTFQRNFQFIGKVFSPNTLLKPLPPALGQSIGRNLSFFARIFTQFMDPKGIESAQKSMGLGQEDKVRRVR